MVRGIGRTVIVVDDDDRQDFLNRNGKAAEQTGTVVYGWSLMTNHAHLLLRSGNAGLSAFMRKRGEREFSDERILGGGEFVESVLRSAGEAQKEMVPKSLLQAEADGMIEQGIVSRGASCG